jgi:hypothetical protein
MTFLQTLSHGFSPSQEPPAKLTYSAVLGEDAQSVTRFS